MYSCVHISKLNLHKLWTVLQYICTYTQCGITLLGENLNSTSLFHITIVTIFRNTKFYHKQLNLNCFLYSKEKGLSQVFTFDSNFCFCSCFCTHYRPQEKNHVFTGHFVCLAGGNLSAAWLLQVTLLAWTKIVNDPLSNFLCSY